MKSTVRWMALIGCVLIVAIVILGVLAGRALLYSPDVNASDGLAFLGSMFGSLLGVVGAIGGAVFIEEFKRNRERRLARQPTIDALAALHGSMTSVGQAAQHVLLGEQITDVEAERVQALSLLTEVDDALTLLDLTSESAGVITFAEARALHALRKALAELRPILEREQSIVANNPPTEPILQIFYQQVGKRAARMTSLINRARHTLDR